MNVEDSSEAIRRRMAELRRELTSDVKEVRRSAQAMTNPMYYVRKHPWACAAVAAAVGFLLVPKKKKPAIQPDAEMLAEYFKTHPPNIEMPQAASSASNSMLKSLAMMGLTWAVRTGLSYAGQQFAAAASQKGANAVAAAEASDDISEAGDHYAAEAAPVEEPWNPVR